MVTIQTNCSVRCSSRFDCAGICLKSHYRTRYEAAQTVSHPAACRERARDRRHAADESPAPAVPKHFFCLLGDAIIAKREKMR
jgi:hypothetical protein